jgi:LysR family hydrogen peroxide-inducible transcriptional activator
MPGPQDLSLRQLQYVVAVADTLGFHKAAERCHVSQPTLSTQVQQIESVLGVTLFERDHRRVRVTLAGEAIVARARRVLVEVDDLLAEATRAGDPFVGTFRVGVIPTVAPYLLPYLTPAVAKRYPKLRLVFREERTADIVEGLGDGRLDAAIVAFPAPAAGASPWAQAEVLQDPFVVAVPKGHGLAKKKRVALSDLDDAGVLLLDDGHCFRDQALAICQRAGAREADFRATSLATLAQMVSAGAGITLLPSLAIPVENRGGQLEIRPFAGPVPGRTIALAWRTSSPYGDAFRALGGLFRDAASHSPAIAKNLVRAPA